MTKQFTLLFALSAALLASFGARAADSVELKVKGSILPAACAPTFAGGGVVDYGAIATNALNTNSLTVLSEKAIAFTVTCDAATKVAIRALDNRKSSIVPGLIGRAPGQDGVTDIRAFGLGTVAGKNIGVYTLRIDGDSVTADGTRPDSIYETGYGPWVKTTLGYFNNDGSLRKSFSAAGSIYYHPAAYKTMAGNLAVQVLFDKGSNLPLSQEIQLDGSATIEVQYL